MFLHILREFQVLEHGGPDTISESILVSYIKNESPICYTGAQTETEEIIRASLSRRRIIKYAPANGNYISWFYK